MVGPFMYITPPPGQVTRVTNSLGSRSQKVAVLPSTLYYEEKRNTATPKKYMFWGRGKEDELLKYYFTYYS